MKTYDIHCDGGTGCSGLFESAETTAAEARSHAAAFGWTHRIDTGARKSGPAPSIDLCPMCSAERARKAGGG